MLEIKKLVKINFLKKLFQEQSECQKIQSFKLYGSTQDSSGPTFCQSRSGSQIFARLSADNKEKQELSIQLYQVNLCILVTLKSQV